MPRPFRYPGPPPPRARTGDDRIVWKLIVKARALPVSLKVEFDLPVYAADEADVRAREEHDDAR